MTSCDECGSSGELHPLRLEGGGIAALFGLCELCTSARNAGAFLYVAEAFALVVSHAVSATHKEATQ